MHHRLHGKAKALDRLQGGIVHGYGGGSGGGQVVRKRAVDQLGQRSLVVQGTVLGPPDQRLWQVDVELLLGGQAVGGVGGYIHTMMLASYKGRRNDAERLPPRRLAGTSVNPKAKAR